MAKVQFVDDFNVTEYVYVCAERAEPGDTIVVRDQQAADTLQFAFRLAKKAVTVQTRDEYAKVGRTAAAWFTAQANYDRAYARPLAVTKKLAKTIQEREKTKSDTMSRASRLVFAAILSGASLILDDTYAAKPLRLSDVTINATPFCWPGVSETQCYVCQWCEQPFVRGNEDDVKRRKPPNGVQYVADTFCSAKHAQEFLDATRSYPLFAREVPRDADKESVVTAVLLDPYCGMPIATLQL